MKAKENHDKEGGTVKDADMEDGGGGRGAQAAP